MLEEKDLNIRKIYIPLLDEGTDVIRPTTGILIEKNIYIVEETKDYDQNEETWLFPPGSVVECSEEYRDGEMILIAKKLIRKEL